MRWNKVFQSEGVEQSYEESATTTDATETAIFSIPLTEGLTSKLKADIAGRKNDGTKNATFVLEATFYRNSGGDVTLVGNVQNLNEQATAGCAYAANLAADTVNQAMVVNVTGTAAETVRWVVLSKWMTAQ